MIIDTAENMDTDAEQHLSKINTLWTVLRKAHGCASSSREAQEIILQRYSLAIFRYLRAAAKDEELAKDLYQEFAVKFVRGDFGNADPSKGQFRCFLKRVLCNLVKDHYRSARRSSQEDVIDLEQFAAPTEKAEQDADREFSDAWKAELLSRTWSALQDWEKDHGKPFYRVLRCRADNPQADSPELAVLVSKILGKSVNPGWVRNRLHFARAKSLPNSLCRKSGKRCSIQARKT